MRYTARREPELRSCDVTASRPTMTPHNERNHIASTRLECRAWTFPTLALRHRVGLIPIIVPTALGRPIMSTAPQRQDLFH